MSDKIFKILSIDGGGIRGVFPAHILYCMTERLGINIGEQFNMIAGTSTGAIVASAIACKIDPAVIVALYREHGPHIFSKKKSFLPAKYQPAIQSLYDNDHLKTILKDIFKDIKLGEISIPMLLPATDIGNGGVHVFKSSYSKDFTRDKEVLLRDAVLASCSAPTYFNPMKFKEYLLADGGLWANNPALAAVIDAQHRLNINLSDIRILSIGTGLAKTCYGVDVDKKWGLLNGWRGKEFISFMMSLQSQSTHNYLQLMMQNGQLLRLNFESELPLALDDCSAIDDLISRADRLFTYNSSEIRDFITN
ncbi:MAG: patatin-like phospholipase family protein [Bacteroidetes bacterium]|nr:patatin-like phospholipase family protein [Bacteroidota bacterium]